jgi:hypothetical protein
MSYFDRSSSIDREVVSKRKSQLRSIAALYLTVKLHSEGEAKDAASVVLEEFANLDGCSFSRKNIIDQEQELLKELQWKLHPPTPQLFLYHFMTLLCTGQNNIHLNSISKVANYILDTLLPHPESRSVASIIAIASLQVALRGVKSTVITSDSIKAFQQFVQKTFQEDLPEMERLCNLALNVFHEGSAGDYKILTLEEVKNCIDVNHNVYETLCI